MTEYLYDSFISHASEDKNDFVLPLVGELQKYGLKIWFDKFSLRIGDSLRESIEMGLAQSRFGIVVFSHSFFAKKWPQAELNGLFAKEIAGQKVILPVWHNITREDLLKLAPIQADKLAANSSDGISAVARSLVEVIRPEALELDTSRADAQKTNARLLEQLRGKYPGYDFRVTTGASPSLDGKPNIPGIIASRYDGDTRVDVLVSDPQLITDNPPKIQVCIKGLGISKVQEALRTGRAQRFVSGEVVAGQTTVPLMNFDRLQGLEMLVIPRLSNPGHLITRVTFGKPPEAVTFPVMDFTPNRAGTDEIELLGTGRGLPFKLYLTLPLNAGGTGSLHFYTDFVECDFTEIDQFLDALKALKKNGAIEITNLETGSVVIEAALNHAELDLFTQPLMDFVRDVTEISKRFGTSLRWPREFNDQDFDTVATLKCIINGLPYGSNFQSTVQVMKRNSTEENSEVLAQFMNGEFSLWLQPEPQRTMLFGVNIPVGSFGLHAERAKVKNLEEAKRKFMGASPGETVLIEVESEGPVFLRQFAKPSSSGLEPDSPV